MELSDFVGLAKSDVVKLDDEELFAAFDGDAVALDRLWRSCRGMVIQAAKRFGMLDFDVVLGVCEEVFMVCVKKYPVRNGFHGYFRKACCHKLCDAIAGQIPVHVPKTVLDCVRSTQKFLGSARDEAEWRRLSVEAGWSEHQVDCALDVIKARYGVSVENAPWVADADRVDFADGVEGGFEFAADCSRRDYVEYLLGRLPEDLAVVVRHYYGIGADELSHSEVGRLLGLTHQAVSLRLKKAREKLAVFASEERNFNFYLQKAG